MKNKKFNNFFLAFVILLFAFGGCTGIYEDGKELANDAKTRITEINVQDLKSMIDTGATFLLIDVRQKDEYSKGNIIGSISIPRGVLEFKINNEQYWEEEFMYPPLKEDEIIIYCKSGARGALATESLKKLGYTNVKNLTGGIVAFDPELAGGKGKKQEESSGCGG